MAHKHETFYDGQTLTAKQLNDAFDALEHAIEYITPVEEINLNWEAGGIQTDTGALNDSANRLRTDYIPFDASIITSTHNSYCCIITYDQSKEFLEAIFNGSNPWHTFTAGTAVNIKSLQHASEVAYYRLVLNSSEGLTGAEFNVEYPYEEVRTGIVADIEELQEVVGLPSPEKDFTDVFWERGGIDTNMGQNSSYNASQRLRTIGYVPLHVSRLTFKESIQAIILYYDDSTTFITGSYGWTTYSGLVKLNPPAGAAYYRVALMDAEETLTGAEVTFTIPAGATGGLLKEFEAVKNRARNPNEIIVDCNGRGDYRTIEEALANAGDSPTNHVTIRVMQGTYYPAPKKGPSDVPYEESNRNLTIVGDNKNKVILRGDAGYYYYQIGVDYGVLRLNGNVTIQNLTILSYSTNYRQVAEENGWDLTSPHCRAYCVHVDGARQQGDVTLIKDCRLINDHFTTVGFGLRGDTTLRIENCELEMTITDDSLSGGSGYGTLYGHLAAGSAQHNQRLEVINCRIKNNSYSQAINLMDASGQTAEGACSAQVQLIGNVCKTTNTAAGFKLPNPNYYYTLDDLCYGNNISSMNVTQ